MAAITLGLHPSRRELLADEFQLRWRPGEAFWTLTGKEIEIDIEPTDKVERIKERVEEKEGIPPQQQRLIYSGKQIVIESGKAGWSGEVGRMSVANALEILDCCGCVWRSCSYLAAILFPAQHQMTLLRHI
ncbi:hypothetical protein H8959_016561 [Pygathrix nigripes]